MESIIYFAQHRKLIDTIDFASLDRHVNVQRGIDGGIIETKGVYYRLRKDIRSSVNES